MCGIDSDLYFLIEKFPMIWSHFAPPGSENELGDLPAGLSLSLSSESPRFLKHKPFVQTFPCLTISEFIHLRDATESYLATEATADTQGNIL